MTDIFTEISSSIVENKDDFSRAYHALPHNEIPRARERVADMSDQKLLDYICKQGERKLKDNGETMNAVDFFTRATKCLRDVREKVPAE